MFSSRAWRGSLHNKRSHWLAALTLSLVLLAQGAHAQAPPPILGDVNGDGVIDVLDIQGATNIALGSGAPVDQADVDESAAINVLDVQVLINSALGVGGLVQPVAGALADEAAKALDGVTCMAISTDGRAVEAEVDPETGAFNLALPVKTTWSLSFVRPALNEIMGTVTFPLADEVVSSLPLPGLSTGALLDLGTVDPGLGASTEDDLRTILAEGGEPLATVDADADGLYDIFEGLLLPYPWQVPGAGIEVPGELDELALARECNECIGYVLDYVSLPALTGIEIEGIPAFVVPIITCFTIETTEWLNDSGMNPFQVALLIYQISASMLPRVEPWLESLDRDDLVDVNENAIPDYIEGQVCAEEDGTRFDPCQLDLDNNGLPDYAEDSDGDGVPNLLDFDFYTPNDVDGDGVPNLDDLDDDNDKTLDYADSAPQDPKAA